MCLNNGLSRFACARTSAALVVMCCLAFVGARVAQSVENVLGMPFSPISKSCGFTETTQNGPSVRASRFLYVSFATAIIKFVADAESGDRSANTISHGQNIGVMRTSFS